MGIPRFNSVDEAMKYYLNKYPEIKERYADKHNASLPYTILPDEYNNVPFNTIFNGQTINTLGEYKEAVNNFSGNGYNDGTQYGW